MKNISELYMKTLSYNSIEEQKRHTYIEQSINTKWGIDRMFEQFEKFLKQNHDREANLIFRGVSDATHKMFNSLQRAYLCDGVFYGDYLTNIIEKVKNWNNEVLKKYLKSINIDSEKNELAYLSLLQHHGLPTPLLDFTRNPFKALYFANENTEKYCYNDDEEDLRNYFSIYYINEDFLLSKNLVIDLERNDIDFNSLVESIYLVKNESIIGNSLNIIAQEGLFLLNTSHKLDLISVLKKLDGNDGKRFFPGYNIHKSLGPFVREKLRERGITKQSLFPNLNELKNEIFF